MSTGAKATRQVVLWDTAFSVFITSATEAEGVQKLVAAHETCAAIFAFQPALCEFDTLAHKFGGFLDQQSVATFAARVVLESADTILDIAHRLILQDQAYAPLRTRALWSIVTLVRFVEMCDKEGVICLPDADLDVCKRVSASLACALEDCAMPPEDRGMSRQHRIGAAFVADLARSDSPVSNNGGDEDDTKGETTSRGHTPTLTLTADQVKADAATATAENNQEPETGPLFARLERQDSVDWSSSLQFIDDPTSPAHRAPGGGGGGSNKYEGPTLPQVVEDQVGDDTANTGTDARWSDIPHGSGGGDGWPTPGYLSDSLSQKRHSLWH